MECCTPRRARLIALALIPLMLAGCFASTQPAPGPIEAPAAGLLLTCPEPCVLPIDVGGVRWEPSVAVNPTNPLHIVASSSDQTPVLGAGPQSWGLAHVTFDGGATWKTVRAPGGPGGDPTHPLSQFAFMDDTVVTFLPDGTLLWSAVVHRTSNVGGSIATLRSEDGGLTFIDPAFPGEGTGVVFLSDSYAFHDKQWFAVTPDGSALLVWNANYEEGHARCPPPAQDGGCSDVLFSRSTDGGRSWTAPGVIDEGRYYSGAFPLIRADGGWVVSYRISETSQIRVAVSTDEGATWNRSEPIDFTTKFPVLAATPGPAGERIHMAYPLVEGNHDSKQTVTLRWSDDGGLTWSAPLALDTPEGEGRTNPAIAPAANGTVIVTFFHVKGSGAEYRAVAVRDGVATEHLVLDTHEGTADLPTRHTGDYMGIAPLPDGNVFAVWNAKHGDAFTVAGARLVAG